VQVLFEGHKSGRRRSEEEGLKRDELQIVTSLNMISPQSDSDYNSSSNTYDKNNSNNSSMRSSSEDDALILTNKHEEGDPGQGEALMNVKYARRGRWLKEPSPQYVAPFVDTCSSTRHAAFPVIQGAVSGRLCTMRKR